MATLSIDTGIKSIDLMLYGSQSPTLVITINDGAASAQKIRIELYGTDRDQIVALFHRFVEDMKPNSGTGLSCAMARLSTEVQS
jgi:hypothetical protein